jgi:hypothetical protein
MKFEKSKLKLWYSSARLCIAGLILFVFFSTSAIGKNLTQYKTSINSARDFTFQMLYPEDEVTGSESAYDDFERRTIAEIRKAVPPTEKIVWENSSIQTDNHWLSAKLDLYEKEPKNSHKREDILTEISERLDAIGKKTAEIENPPISQRTKDEDKRKLAEILSREEYQKPDPTDKSLLLRIYEAVMKWLRELFPEPDITPGQISGFGQIAKILVYVFLSLILAGIGFVIYKFAPQFLRRYRTREKKDKSDRVILGERLSADQKSSDLLNEAEQLAREGNLRGAIRKGYIALLCELSDRKLIGLSHHKTNRDYLRDVRGKGELFQNMNGLTLNFERHWYGFESASEADWEEFKIGYKKALGARLESRL